MNKNISKLFIRLEDTISFKSKTVSEYQRSFESRMRSFRKLANAKQVIEEGYVPSDMRDAYRDVAFGVTQSGLYLDAKMILDTDGNPPEKLGMISHSSLLVAAGLSKDIDDPKPKEDFVVRGIVKPRLDGRVIFWEEPTDLFKRPKFVKIAIENLLARNIIKDTTEIYGEKADIPIAQAFDIQQDW